MVCICWRTLIFLSDGVYLLKDPHNLRMSQKLSDTIAKKKKQMEEEQERERIEREKKKQEHEEKLKKERERQQEKLRRLNTSESLGIECKCAVTNVHSFLAFFHFISYTHTVY